MSIIDNKRFGAVLRVFSKTPDQVEKNVKQAAEAALAVSNLSLGAKPLFSEVLVLVPSDTRHIDHDCGQTLERLRSQLKGSAQISVQAIKEGDVFCGALNYAAATLSSKRCHYMCVLSHGALSYCTEDTIADALVALEDGAKAVGIALEELSASILEGRLANTFAIWDLVALISVGGFDLRAAQPRLNDPTFPYMRGWNAEKGEVFYPRAGVEEIIPLVRLVDAFGPCIAPLQVAGRAWKAPDPTSDPQGYERHLKKMGTKEVRQTALANSIGADLSVLKGGVMKAYRTF